MRHTANITLEQLGALKRVGFWRSKEEPLLPHPSTLVDEAWDADERQRVIAYLESSYYIPVFNLGPSWCRLGCSPQPRDIGHQTLTDGTWVYPEGFVHYVRSHCVKPPVEFLEHIRRRDFRVAELATLHENSEPGEPAKESKPGRWVVSHRRVMTLLRILTGVASIVLALLFAAGAAIGFWDEFATRLQSSALEFHFIRVGILIFQGWQIWAFYSVLALVAVAFSLLTVYAFSSHRNAA